MKTLENKRGQALTEALVTLMITLCVCTVGAPTVYYAWAKLWLRHVVYESLICEIKGVPTFRCEEQARKQIREFLPFGKLIRYNISHPPFRVHAQARLQITDKLWVGEGMTLWRSSGGFVNWYFLLPLALTLVTGFALVGIFITERAKHHQICRDTLLRASATIEDGVQSLLALNRPIQALQFQRNSLEAARMASVDPYSRASIEAAIAANQLAQVAMTVKQQTFKRLALAKSQAELASLTAHSPMSTYGLRYSQPRLILQPQATRHTAKQQFRPLNFSRIHRIEAVWRVSLKEYENIFRFPKHFAQVANIQCATTIRQEGISWIAQLSQ